MVEDERKSNAEGEAVTKGASVGLLREMVERMKNVRIFEISRCRGKQRWLYALQKWFELYSRGRSAKRNSVVGWDSEGKEGDCVR